VSITSIRPLLSIVLILSSVPLSCQCNETVITVQQKRKAAPPILNLAADDLRVKIGGKATRIGSITDRTPVRVSFVIDTGAKQTQQSWATTRRILDNVMTTLPAGTPLALITFADKAEPILGLQNNGPSIQDALKTLSPSGAKVTKEAMFGAMSAGASAFEHPQPGDAEFLVTASEENLGSKLQAEIERQFLTSHVRLFGVSFDFSKLPGHPQVGAFVNAGESFSSAEAISKSSGGLWVRAQAGGEFADIIGKLIKGIFVLQLQPEHPLERAEDLNIELLKNGRISPNDVVLLYPQKLYPCQ